MGLDMNEDVARHLIRTAFQIARELQGVMMLLKHHLDEAEYAAHARRLASALDAVNVALLDEAFTKHPQLRTEVEASIQKYDRFL